MFITPISVEIRISISAHLRSVKCGPPSVDKLRVEGANCKRIIANEVTE